MSQISINLTVFNKTVGIIIRTGTKCGEEKKREIIVVNKVVPHGQTNSIQ